MKNDLNDREEKIKQFELKNMQNEEEIQKLTEKQLETELKIEEIKL